MCMKDGVYLGANENGLFRIMCGQSDNGVEINSIIRSGNTDFGIYRNKRARFFYFGFECTGELILSILCDGVVVATYPVSPGGAGLRRVRVPIGRQHEGMYWAWQIENVDGSFFKLRSVFWTYIIP